MMVAKRRVKCPTIGATSTWMAASCILGATLVEALGGCASHPGPPPPRPPAAAPVVRPICSIETAFDATKPPRERVFPAQNWFVLMLHSYRSVGEIARPLHD